MNNGDKSAYPEPYINDPNLALSIQPGITKRELFAAMAMQGLLSNSWYISDLMSNKVMLVRESFGYGR